jgi:ABC-2 type transport system permease protein
VRFDAVLRSEATKLLALRSTRWTLLALIASTVGFGALVAYNIATNGGQVLFDPTAACLAGLAFGQLAMAVLGVLTMTTEYGSGAIRSTFAAVPRRGLVIAAKTLLVAVVGLLAGLVSSFAAFFVGRVFFFHHGGTPSLTDAGVLRAVVGGGLYVMASGLFGLALGAVLRHTAGAITSAIAGLLVVPGLTNLLPGQWGSTVHRYFTSNAGSRITDVVHDGGLSPWAGYGVFTLWWVVILGLGYLVVQRRDA